MEEITDRLEFNKLWWSDVQEGEPLAQDEIDEVRWMLKEIESLRAELQLSRENAANIEHNRKLNQEEKLQALRERDEAQQTIDTLAKERHDLIDEVDDLKCDLRAARQANAALLDGLREIISEMQPIVESRYSFVGAAIKAIQDDAIDLLAQYDTTQPNQKEEQINANREN